MPLTRLIAFYCIRPHSPIAVFVCFCDRANEKCSDNYNETVRNFNYKYTAKVPASCISYILNDFAGEDNGGSYYQESSAQ